MSVIENLTQEKKRLDEERRKRKEAEAAAAEARKKAEAAKHVQNENVSKDFLRVFHLHEILTSNCLTAERDLRRHLKARGQPQLHVQPQHNLREA